MIKNKLLLVLALTIFVSLSPITFFAQELKPDLIISSVTSSTFIPEKKHKPGEPVRSDGYRKMIEYTITIKNIGTDVCSDKFYLSWQRSPITDEDSYSRTNSVNMERNIIPIGGTIEIKITDGFTQQHYLEGAKFFINTDGKTRNGYSYPVVEELNYVNNTYMY
jgi:hypothetical protein